MDALPPAIKANHVYFPLQRFSFAKSGTDPVQFAHIEQRDNALWLVFEDLQVPGVGGRMLSKPILKVLYGTNTLENFDLYGAVAVARSSLSGIRLSSCDPKMLPLGALVNAQTMKLAIQYKQYNGQTRQIQVRFQNPADYFSSIAILRDHDFPIQERNNLQRNLGSSQSDSSRPLFSSGGHLDVVSSTQRDNIPRTLLKIIEDQVKVSDAQITGNVYSKAFKLPSFSAGQCAYPASLPSSSSPTQPDKSVLGTILQNPGRDNELQALSHVKSAGSYSNDELSVSQFLSRLPASSARMTSPFRYSSPTMRPPTKFAKKSKDPITNKTSLSQQPEAYQRRDLSSSNLQSQLLSSPSRKSPQNGQASSYFSQNQTESQREYAGSQTSGQNVGSLSVITSASSKSGFGGITSSPRSIYRFTSENSQKPTGNLGLLGNSSPESLEQPAPKSKKRQASAMEEPIQLPDSIRIEPRRISALAATHKPDFAANSSLYQKDLQRWLQSQNTEMAMKLERDQLGAYAALPENERLSLLNKELCALIMDDNFLQLVEDMEATWKTLGLERPI